MLAVIMPKCLRLNALVIVILPLKCNTAVPFKGPDLIFKLKGECLRDAWLLFHLEIQ